MIISEYGVSLKNPSELLSDLLVELRKIYGNDFILDPQTLDGQMANMYAQKSADINENFLRVMGILNPNTSYGKWLDLIGNIKNIYRIAGETDNEYRKRLVGISAGTAWDLAAENEALNIPSVLDCLILDHTNDSNISIGTVNYVFNGGSPTDIAKFIKKTLTLGIYTIGAQATTINFKQPNRLDSAITVRYDFAAEVNLHLSITLKSRSTFNLIPDSTEIKNHILTKYNRFRISESANSYDIGCFITEKFKEFEILSISVSRDGVNFSDVINPTLKEYLKLDISRIAI